MKWTYLNADKYVLSVSTDGEQWEEVAAEENSFGGICSYHLNGKQVKYIRISDVSGESSRTPMLYEVEAYEKLEIADTGTAPGQGGRLPAGDCPDLRRRSRGGGRGSLCHCLVCETETSRRSGRVPIMSARIL